MALVYMGERVLGGAPRDGRVLWEVIRSSDMESTQQKKQSQEGDEQM